MRTRRLRSLTGFQYDALRAQCSRVVPSRGPRGADPPRSVASFPSASDMGILTNGAEVAPVYPAGHAGAEWQMWGGHGYGAPGDEWIDLPEPSDPLAPRGRGEPGLVLLHVISREARGRDGSGTQYNYDRPALGVVIPSGSPSISFLLAEGR